MIESNRPLTEVEDRAATLRARAEDEANYPELFVTHTVTSAKRGHDRHGGALNAQATCTCGWTGPWQSVRLVSGWDLVKRDAKEHIAAVSA